MLYNMHIKMSISRGQGQKHSAEQLKWLRADYEDWDALVSEREVIPSLLPSKNGDHVGTYMKTGDLYELGIFDIWYC